MCNTKVTVTASENVDNIKAGNKYELIHVFKEDIMKSGICYVIDINKTHELEGYCSSLFKEKYPVNK